MPKRYQSPEEASSSALQPATALRRALRHGYTGKDLRADILAGIVVGIVALPLSMALAVASGVAPQHGLYTAIVAGAVVAALGGSMVQVSGPTAAFVVLLAPIAAKYGVGGLVTATVLAGIILMLMGVLRLGGLIQFVPYPVTTGFTAGIAVVIATLQLKDFFGLTVTKMPEHYLERVAALARALPTLRWQDLSVGVLTLALLLLWPRLTRKVPAPLVALAIAGVVAAVLTHFVPGFTVATIRSRFSYELGGQIFQGIPQLPPLPVLPWHLPGGDGKPLGLSLNLLRELTPPAFAIAMLGAIESLLSAVVADGMTGGSHDPDAELLAQGTGNIIAPFFGGIAATGAIARTATSIRSGAKSPIAAIVHSLFVLLSVLALAPVLGYLPMASLAALLLIVAWNMSEAKHFLHALRVAPRSDVLVYEVAGPLFFGAAQKAMSALHRTPTGIAVVLLDLSAVPAMDATGMVSLEAAVERLQALGVFVVLAGVQSQPMRVLARSGIHRRREGEKKITVFRSMDRAVAAARKKSRVGGVGIDPGG